MPSAEQTARMEGTGRSAGPWRGTYPSEIGREGGRVKLALGSELQSSLVKSDCSCVCLIQKKKVTSREHPLIGADREIQVTLQYP